MKNKKKVTKRRNWALVFIASILLVLGLALCVLAIMYASVFGWRSILVGASGFAISGAAVMSIIENDPTWILLNLIISF